MKQKNPQNKLQKLMSTPKFAMVMNGVRILLLVWAIGMTIYLFNEIEAVKMLAYDSCQLCMNKTGCLCTCVQNPFGS